MLGASLAALLAALLLFTWIGLRARSSESSLDDYLTARGSQSASALGLSFVASGLGAWILFAPPELGAFVGPVAVAGYALGAALPFAVFAAFGGAIRRLLPEGRSLGEFAQVRLGTPVRRWVAMISALYMLCFLTAELTAVGAIAVMLSGLPAWVAVVGVAVSTLIYTTWGGLRASLLTDRWQAWLLLALLALIGMALLIGGEGTPPAGAAIALPSAPPGVALSVALTLVIAVTAANLFHQGYWQRVWSAQDLRSLKAGAWLGGLLTVAAIAVVGGLGMLAVDRGVNLGQPPVPFFALLTQAPAWLKIATLVLAVALVASSVDTLQSGLASLILTESQSSRAPATPTRQGTSSLTTARVITVALMVPVVMVALQGISVLRLFLIADLLCATAVVPVLLGVWRRMTVPAALAGCAAGLAGAVLPGWLEGGSVAAGLLAASFPGSVPTLAPFVGALLASTLVSVGVAWVGSTQKPAAKAG
jgi:Na+/proline symporter